jgi:hypothetical protein
MWHKAQAQSNQGVAGQPCVGTFPKIVFTAYQSKSVRGVSNVGRQCKEETWLPGQVAWPTGLSSGPHAPNLRTQHHLIPPINMIVLPQQKV